MDISKFYKSLDSIRKDLSNIASDLRKVEKEASFVDGIIAEKVPVNVAAVREAIENISEGDGTGTLNYVINILLGVSGADLLSDEIKFERSKSSASSTPKIDTTPHTENGAQSSILGESTLKKFYKGSEKQNLQERGFMFGSRLDYEQLLNNPYLGGSEIDEVSSPGFSYDDPMFDSFNAGVADDPAARYQSDAVQFNGDFDDFANNLDPNSMSVDEIKSRFEEPASEFTTGEEVEGASEIPPSATPADIEDGLNFDMPSAEGETRNEMLPPISTGGLDIGEDFGSDNEKDPNSPYGVADFINDENSAPLTGLYD